MVSRILRLASRLALAGLGVLVLLYFFPSLVLLFGRDPVVEPCSRWRAVVDTGAMLSESKEAEALRAHCTLIRTEGSLALWETSDGRWWVPGGSDKILPILLTQQRRRIYGSPAAGDTVVDCGAHIGVFTKTALAAGAAKVIAIEPGQEAIECFKRNFEAEMRAGKVVLVPKGVWDTDGALTFYENGNGGAAGSFVGNSPASRAVRATPVARLDTLVGEFGLNRVDFVKMDIKGSTARALTGGKETLRRWRPRLAISTEEAVDNPREIMSMAIGWGYGVKCGPCLLLPNELGGTPRREIRPSVLFFQ
jgi:FkbM family methyltransferase